MGRVIKHVVTTHEFFEINEKETEAIVFEALWANVHDDRLIGQHACSDKPFEVEHETISYKEIDGVIYDDS